MFFKISQNLLQKNLCQSLFFKKVAGLRPGTNFIQKETLAQVFSCEFCKILENFFLQNTPVAASNEVKLHLKTQRQVKGMKNRFFGGAFRAPEPKRFRTSNWLKVEETCSVLQRGI